VYVSKTAKTALAADGLVGVSLTLASDRADGRRDEGNAVHESIRISCFPCFDEGTNERAREIRNANKGVSRKVNKGDCDVSPRTHSPGGCVL